MRFALYFLALVPFAAHGQIPLDQAGKRGTIEVRTHDSFGRRLSDATISLEPTKSLSAAARLKGTAHSLENVEYGSYRLTAERTGYETASIQVDLDEPALVVLIGLVPNAILHGGNRTAVTGRVKGRYPDGCRSVRLVSLFSTERPLDATAVRGAFTFTNVAAGKYVALLFDGANICRLTEVEVLIGGGSITIE